jgi:hypothetical protein
MRLACRWSFASPNYMVERPGSKIGPEVVHLFQLFFQDHLLEFPPPALSECCCIERKSWQLNYGNRVF